MSHNDWFRKNHDHKPEVELLLENIKAEIPNLEKLLEECSGRDYEDPIYRFYHQSFKVYTVQRQTHKIVKKLQSLLPGNHLNCWFMEIVKEGTGRSFELQDNMDWLAITRPMLEAFFHARYFLEMTIKYGKELEFPPLPMPVGWAALLYLYNLG